MKLQVRPSTAEPATRKSARFEAVRPDRRGAAGVFRGLAYVVGFYVASGLVKALPRTPRTPPAPRARSRPPIGAPEASAPRRRGRLRWWHEVAYVILVYGTYSVVRNTQGSAAVSAAEAMGNALHVIRLEEWLGMYHEQTIQQAFLGNRLFIGFWNVFYGSFHFVVTIFALVLLFRRFPERYRKFRNTLAFTTCFALVGFALFPLMPPRLLPASYGYVDTLAQYGTLWSFDSGAMHKISNQYAAMPSLHFAWSTWSALALVPALRRWWAKALAGLYPAMTLFAIVVTANHFWLDAAGGALVLTAGALVGFPLGAYMERRSLAGVSTS